MTYDVHEASGRLKHHVVDCSSCDGTGRLGGSPKSPPCNACDQGKVRWEPWFDRGVETCADCDREVPAMLVGQFDDLGWVCLECYLAHHRRFCGCAEWRWAEEAFLRAR